MNNEKPKFSFAYMFFGALGHLFHRNQINTDLPFWRCAGIDILCWSAFVGILSNIFENVMFPKNDLASIFIAILTSILFGFVGAWRFNKYRKNDFEISEWKKREKMSIVFGILWFAVIFVISFAILTESNANKVETATFSNNAYYVENGIICDNAMNVVEGYIIDTNEDVNRVLDVVHYKCPGDIAISGMFTEDAVFSKFPQLESYSFVKPIFHVYASESGHVAYWYITRNNY